MARRKTIGTTPDGHYVVIDGRRWRATNPNLPEEERKLLVSELMRARGDVGRALKAKDEAARGVMGRPLLVYARPCAAAGTAGPTKNDKALGVPLGGPSALWSETSARRRPCSGRASRGLA